jgi:hypothetical protein
MPDYGYELANNMGTSSNNLRLLNSAATAAMGSACGVSRNGKKF